MFRPTPSVPIAIPGHRPGYLCLRRFLRRLRNGRIARFFHIREIIRRLPHCPASFREGRIQPTTRLLLWPPHHYCRSPLPHAGSTPSCFLLSLNGSLALRAALSRTLHSVSRHAAVGSRVDSELPVSPGSEVPPIRLPGLSQHFRVHGNFHFVPLGTAQTFFGFRNRDFRTRIELRSIRFLLTAAACFPYLESATTPAST